MLTYTRLSNNEKFPIDPHAMSIGEFVHVAEQVKNSKNSSFYSSLILDQNGDGYVNFEPFGWVIRKMLNSGRFEEELAVDGVGIIFPAGYSLLDLDDLNYVVPIDLATDSRSLVLSKKFIMFRPDDDGHPQGKCMLVKDNTFHCQALLKNPENKERLLIDQVLSYWTCDMTQLFVNDNEIPFQVLSEISGYLLVEELDLEDEVNIYTEIRCNGWRVNYDPIIVFTLV
ncbi:hypothetical protein GOV14_06630 [Candidatus Pacearchaeota archaeon]|nr:hypothetical protein [Candidatus Pacearchaeota archaeon]